MHRRNAKNSVSRREPASHIQSLDWPGTIIFLTVIARARRPYFATEAAAMTFNRVWSDRSKWQVGEYVLMPDHVHLFVRPCKPGESGLREWVTWWKRSVSRDLGVHAWHRSVWDTRIRSIESYNQKKEYVRQNPVRAGLVKIPDEWPYRGKIHDLVWRGGVD
jgi:REP element-mobilizing transposase RayT